jgi:hypothetical protein
VVQYRIKFAGRGACAAYLDGLDGILDLKETTLGGEGVHATIVLSPDGKKERGTTIIRINKRFRRTRDLFAAASGLLKECARGTGLPLTW